MQDTFIKVFEKLDLYNPNTNLGAWINRIAINTSLDKIKVRKIQWLPLNEEYATRVDEHSYSYEEERSIQWKVEQVKEAITMLPEGYRVILTLLLIEGLNSEEVAEYLKITPSTVRSQYTRARRRLVENLKK
jgi:RNA polymerase sigma-70 factor (ECF subfamily)